MALLVFPADKLEPQLAALLDPDLRRYVADRVNKAILKYQGQKRDAAIRRLVRLRAWAENTAREGKKDLPDHIELGLDKDSWTAQGGLADENGHEPMIT